MPDQSAHQHKRESQEGQVGEADLIPDGRTIAAIPDFAAPEGTEVSYLDSSSNAAAHYRITDMNAMTGFTFPMTDCEIRAYLHKTVSGFPNDTDSLSGNAREEAETSLSPLGSTA